VSALEADLAARLLADPHRVRCLEVLRDTLGPPFWIAAGFARNLIWDADFGSGAARSLEDLDVLYFDASDTRAATDSAYESRLIEAAPDLPWQVRNQARMHRRNGDSPYRDLEDAMAHWLETATGIAARLDPAKGLVITSAYGLEDLFDGVLRATASGRARPRELEERMAAKGWRARWPGMRLELGR
jgi:hypothetical protein